MFDLPVPCVVLYAHAGIAAIGVQHTAVQPLLLRRLEKPVDGSSMNAGGTADEHGRSSRVVRGDGSSLSGGELSKLRRNKAASHKTRKKGTWKGGNGRPLEGKSSRWRIGGLREEG
jgi:hypothetical protein